MSRARFAPAAVLYGAPALLIALVVALTVALPLLGLPALARGLLQGVLWGLLVWIGGSLYAAVRRKDEPSDLPELTRAAFPQLWATVDELAVQVGTPAPTRIVVSAQANAQVSELDGGAHRELELGLPYFAALTVGELRAVLGHELAHFAGGDTTEPTRVRRARGFLGALHARASWPAKPLVGLVLRLYLRAAAPAQRDAERLADAASVAAGGREAAVSSFAAGLRGDLASERVVEAYVPLFEAARSRASLADAIAAVIAHNRADIDAAVDDLVAHEEPSPYDNHPVTRERLAAVAALPDPGSAHDARPALDLVGGASALLDVEQELLPQPWPVSSWDAVVAAGLHDEVRGDAGRLRLELVETGLATEASLDAALTALERYPEALAARADVAPEDAAEFIADLTTRLVAGALADVPGARPALDWTREAAWLLPDGRRVHPADVVGQASDPAALRAALVDLGADLGRVTDAAALPEEAPELWDVFTFLRDPAGQYVLLATYSTGVLALPQEFSKEAARLGDYAREAQEHALGRVLAPTLDHLRQTPGARWFPREEIADVKVWYVPVKVTLVERDGTETRFTAHMDHHEIIDVASHGGGLLLLTAKNQARLAAQGV